MCLRSVILSRKVRPLVGYLRATNCRFFSTVARDAERYRCKSAGKLLELDDAFQLFDVTKNVTTVLDLAAAPGAFTEVALERMHAAQAQHSSVDTARNLVPLSIAVDLRSFERIDGCVFLKANVLDHQRVKAFVRKTLQQTTPLHSEAPRALQVVLHDGVSVVQGQHELSATYSQAHMALGALKLAVELLTEQEVKQQKQHQDHSIGSDPKLSSSCALDGDDVRWLSAVKKRCASYAFVTKAMHSPHFNRLIDQTRKYFVSVDVLKPRVTRADSRETYVVGRGFRYKSLLRNNAGRVESRQSHTPIQRDVGFSLPPNPNDVMTGRQVVWLCLSCRTTQLGTSPCRNCCRW